MHNLKCPNVKSIVENYKCPFDPVYGLIIIPDEFNQVDEKYGLITDLDTKTNYSTHNYSLVGGVIVAISDDFHYDEIGDTPLKIGDRILAQANRATLLVDPSNNIQLAQFREPDIFAVIAPDAKISVN